MRVISNNDIARAVNSLLEEGVDSRQVAQSLAAFLIQERRSADADRILKNIERLRQNQGIYDLRVTSAFRFTEQTIELVRQVTTKAISGAKHVVLSLRRDPLVIGGIRIESDELLLEYTVAGRLQELSRTVNVNT